MLLLEAYLASDHELQLIHCKPKIILNPIDSDISVARSVLSSHVLSLKAWWWGGWGWKEGGGGATRWRWFSRRN